MNTISPAPTLAEALSAANDTRALEIGKGVVQNIAGIFRTQFGNQPAVIIADTNTYRAAGQVVSEVFQAARHPLLEPFIFRSPDLYAEQRFVNELETALKKHAAIPVAVGSGTINDLTKLAAHRAGRSYMSVATAASMDGYTAFGASITVEGSKQTILCPAPAAVVADLDFICSAPTLATASGYADLLAKVTAGADWIVADALEVEHIDTGVWNIAQGRLREFVADAAGVRAHQPEAIGSLIEGLMLGGFAMQASKSSRPASGAEHQFSHLWDMQHHTHNSQAPSHGFKVGIGTLAVAALYEQLFKRLPAEIDIDAYCEGWPTESQWLAQVRARFGDSEVGTVAAKEIVAKAGDPETLRAQLLKLRAEWPQMRTRIEKQLMPFTEIRQRLQAAGAPFEPEQIGISRERLRDSYWQAFLVRRRFTILDVAVRTGLLDICLAEIFGPRGVWPI